MTKLTAKEEQHKQSAIATAKNNIAEIREIIDELEKGVVENESQLACLATQTLGHWMDDHWQEATHNLYEEVTGIKISRNQSFEAEGT